MIEKTMWVFSTVSAEDGTTLTELCRSDNLRLMEQVITASWATLGRVTFEHGTNSGYDSTVWMHSDGAEDRILGYITIRTHMLLESRDTHL